MGLTLLSSIGGLKSALLWWVVAACGRAQQTSLKHAFIELLIADPFPAWDSSRELTVASSTDAEDRVIAWCEHVNDGNPEGARGCRYVVEVYAQRASVTARNRRESSGSGLGDRLVLDEFDCIKGWNKWMAIAGWIVAGSLAVVVALLTASNCVAWRRLRKITEIRLEKSKKNDGNAFDNLMMDINKTAYNKLPGASTTTVALRLPAGASARRPETQFLDADYDCYDGAGDTGGKRGVQTLSQQQQQQHQTLGSPAGNGSIMAEQEDWDL
jgi:hypothetical protein